MLSTDITKFHTKLFPISLHVPFKETYIHLVGMLANVQICQLQNIVMVCLFYKEPETVTNLALGLHSVQHKTTSI
jgi:hypothetical protein